MGLEFNRELLFKIGELFESYGSTISYFVEFKELAYYITEIGNFLKNFDIDSVDVKSINIGEFKSLIGAFLIDLENWKDSIFIEQDATDIHFWDHQIESSYRGLISFFESDEEDDDDDDVILF